MFLTNTKFWRMWIIVLISLYFLVGLGWVGGGMFFFVHLSLIVMVFVQCNFFALGARHFFTAGHRPQKKQKTEKAERNRETQDLMNLSSHLLKWIISPDVCALHAFCMAHLSSRTKSWGSMLTQPFWYTWPFLDQASYQVIQQTRVFPQDATHHDRDIHENRPTQETTLQE